MSFMQPEIWQENYYEIETTHGTEIVPVEVCGILDVSELTDEDYESHVWQDLLREWFGDYCEGEPLNAELKIGWLYRLSAPGYMDCTDTGSAETEEEAIECLLNTYGADCDGAEDWEFDLIDRLNEIREGE